MTGYETFKLWTALKLHFRTDYEYFKYNGATNVSQQSFENNSNKFIFYKLSRKYTKLEDFFLANLVYADIKWDGDLLRPEADQNFKNFLKNKQMLTQLFKNQILELSDVYQNALDNYGKTAAIESLDGYLKVRNGETPYLLRLVYKGKITIEVLIILDILMNFFPYWEKEIKNDLLWPEMHRRCVKFRPWVSKSISVPKYKEILKGMLTQRGYYFKKENAQL